MSRNDKYLLAATVILIVAAITGSLLGLGIFFLTILVMIAGLPE